MIKINIINKGFITCKTEPFYIHKVDYKTTNIGDIIAPEQDTRMLCEVTSNEDGIVHAKFIVDEPVFLDTEHLKLKWIKVGVKFTENSSYC